MSKDPAVLWYWNDWYSATVLLSRFLKGCYMDLLHAQFNNGRLSLEEIKICLGADFANSWLTLQKKFKQDENGLFFNERLEREKEKREAFSESRRANILKRYSTYEGSKSTYEDTSVEHMNHHMENENRNRNKNRDDLEEKGGVGGKETFSNFPNEQNLEMILPEIKKGAARELLKITKQQDLAMEDIQKLWEVFKAQHFTGKKFYADPGDVYSHFINWIKGQKIEKNGKQLSKAEQRMERLKHSINR